MLCIVPAAVRHIWHDPCHPDSTPMSILCDSQIRELVGIEPFEENVRRGGRVSYGVSSYGYDVRVGSLFKIFTPTSPHGGQAIVDPKGLWRRHVRHHRHQEHRP